MEQLIWIIEVYTYIFENGIYMENVKEIKHIKEDFEKSFSDSKKLSDKDVKVGFLKSLWQAILRLFAPLF